MRSIANRPETIVDEMAEGIVLASCGRLEKIPGIRAIARKEREKDKVQIVSGGGSGYEPLYAGFIGRGMADAMTIGNLYTSPSAYSIYETSKHVDCGRGIVFVYGNYAGDILNYDMASELLEQEGIRSKSVVVNDALLSDLESAENRWGVAGIVYALKAAGGASLLNYSFDGVIRLSERAVKNMRTVTLILEDAPNGGKMMHYGKGVSGEPGIELSPPAPASEIARKTYEWQKSSLGLGRGDEMCVMVNSYGSTTFMETYVLYREIHMLAEMDLVSIYDSRVGSYYRAEGWEGCSITFLKLDDELKSCYDAEADSPSFKKYKENA
ncbi:MAG: dihydroxyacetone kinase subunit DhaK [Synergistaceae bacterium]|jgi:dihydroxyacetone kinase-like protein|nr:dihydroxyacetone kinase subunit DhaK [Synergistaceae bacterium]